MKKLILILVIACSIQMSAQEQHNWVTDYKVAMQQSESQDKPIFAFVTDNQVTEVSKRLDKELFASEAFKMIASKVILLKLDVSDKKSYNYRIGSHYIKQKSAPGVAFVDKNNNTIGDPLVDISANTIQEFITFINSKL